jgi:hypothetical protein
MANGIRRRGADGLTSSSLQQRLQGLAVAVRGHAGAGGV